MLGRSQQESQIANDLGTSHTTKSQAHSLSDVNLKAVLPQAPDGHVSTTKCTQAPELSTVAAFVPLTLHTERRELLCLSFPLICAPARAHRPAHVIT